MALNAPLPGQEVRERSGLLIGLVGSSPRSVAARLPEKVNQGDRGYAYFVLLDRNKSPSRRVSCWVVLGNAARKDLDVKLGPPDDRTITVGPIQVCWVIIPEPEPHTAVNRSGGPMIPSSWPAPVKRAAAYIRSLDQAKVRR